MGITKAGPVSAGMFAAIQSKMGGVAATVAAASATVVATAPGCRVVYRAAKKAFVGR